MRLGLALCATALLVTAAVASPVGKGSKWVDPATVKDADATVLLPGNVRPERYELAINTHPEKLPDDLNYDGSVKITVRTTENVTDIHLHAGLGIKVIMAQLMEEGGSTTNLAMVPEEYDKLKLTSPAVLVANKTYTIFLMFTGKHRTDSNGFYLSSYTGDEGERWLLTTQFEAAEARSAFPCFDEPQYKAIYSIKITISDEVYNKGYRVLTNTPSKKEPPSIGGKRNFEFEDSPVALSSYLVAMIVSDFESTDPMDFDSSVDGSSENKTFQTWGQSKFISTGQGELSQTAGTAALEVLTRALGVEYPYQKVDQVGIPDFTTGAMENWGLITYRERRIFHSSANGSEFTKQSDVGVICHELAHQWFGNLVTLHWWSDIWLNEGFARYFEYIVGEQIDKNDLNTTDWDMEGQLLTDETRNLAFGTDGSEKVNALYAEIYDPSLYMSNFGDIPYSKGSSVLRMLQHVLSKDIFYEGLHNYLNETQGKVGHPEDLFKGLDEAYEAAATQPNLKGLTVATFMASWHKNPGYPVVTLQQSTEYPNKYTLTQSRFLWAAPSDNNAKQLYTVPISYSTDTKDDWEETTATTFLPADGTPVVLTIDDHAYVVINNQATGYYRVNYDKKNWDALAKEIANPQTKIHKYNRVQIVDDALSFARSSQQDYGVSYAMALDMVRGLKAEKEYVVWRAIFNQLGFLSTKMAAKDDMYNYFKRFIQELVADKFEEMSLSVDEVDTHTHRLTRILIAEWACKYELPECLVQAKERFEMDFPEEPNGRLELGNGDNRDSIYCSAVSQMDSAFDTLRGKVVTEIDNLSHRTFLGALGCSTNFDKVIGLLSDLFLVPTIPVRTQDLAVVFSYIATARKENVGVVIAFIKDNLESLGAAPVVKDNNLLPRFLATIGGRTVSDADMAALNDLVAAIKSSGTEDIQKLSEAADAAAASATTSKAWLEAKEQSMRDWFEQSYSSSDDDGGAANIAVSAVIVGLSCLVLRLLR